MNEKELGAALLHLDAAQLAGTPDVRWQTWLILDRDRRRVRWLTGLTFAVWLLAGALILIGLVNFGLVFPAQAKLLQEIEAGTITPAQRDQVQRLVLVSFMKGTFLISLSVAIMAVAATSTVVLILASRRATLRQVNASLAVIAEQIKQLRPAAPPPAQA